MAKPSTRRKSPRKPQQKAATQPHDATAEREQGTAAEQAKAPASTEAPVEQQEEQAHAPNDAGDADTSAVDPHLDGGEDADEIFAEEPAAQEEPKTAAADPKPSAGPTRVMVGRVEGILHRVPIEAVQALVGKEATTRAAGMNTPIVRDLQVRMRATDGRCAPMIFTQTDRDAPPFIYAGLETLAGALALGHDHVFVIIIPAEQAPLVQGLLVARMGEMRASKDEDLLWGEPKR